MKLTDVDIQEAREYIHTERSESMIFLTKNEWHTIQRAFISMHRHIRETDDMVAKLEAMTADEFVGWKLARITAKQ